MSQLNVDTIKNRLGTAGPTVLSLTVTNNVTVGGALTVTGSINTSGIITSTSIVVSAGTTALPSISPTGDTNTGIFFPAADTIAFSEGGVEALRVDSSGRLLIGISTSGNANGGVLQLSSGITFPATAVAATDANTLDDYEEGTWTPSVGGNATYTTQIGSYTKIGRVVFVSVAITIGTLGTGSSTTITSLPFTTAIGLAALGHVSYWQSASRSVTSLMAATNSTEIVFTDTTTAATGTNVNAGILGNGTRLDFSIIYRV